MSDTVDIAAEAPSGPADEQPAQAEAPATPEPKGTREARYRVERNEARGERDALADQLTQLQTRELHRLAAEHLAQPEDIELSGRALADYLTPEGWLDADAVAEAAASLVQSRPGLAKNLTLPAVDPSQGHGARSGTTTPTFAGLFS